MIARKGVAGILDGRFNPVPAFLHRGIRQTDGGKLRQTRRHIHLDGHGIGFHANNAHAEYFDEQFPVSGDLFTVKNTN